MNNDNAATIARIFAKMDDDDKSAWIKAATSYVTLHVTPCTNKLNQGDELTTLQSTVFYCAKSITRQVIHGFKP